MHSVDDRRTMRVGRASAIEGAGDRFAAMARLAVPLRVPVGGFGAVDVDRLASDAAAPVLRRVGATESPSGVTVIVSGGLLHAPAEHVPGVVRVRRGGWIGTL